MAILYSHNLNHLIFKSKKISKQKIKLKKNLLIIRIIRANIKKGAI